MKKLIITLILMALFFLGWYLLQDQEQEQAVIKSNAEKSPAKTAVQESQPAKSEQSTTIKPTTTPNTILPDGQQFHQDKLIDAIMGLVHYSICHSYFDESTDEQEKFTAMSEKQRNHLAPHLDKCNDEKDQAKNYSQNRLMTALSYISQDPVKYKTYLSLYSQNKPYTAEQTSEIFKQLSQLTGIELLFTASMYQNFFSQEVYPLVKEQLMAHDMDMVQFVTKQATMLISCEQDADCSANSTIMYQQCMEFEQACGLNLATFIEQHYTTGLRNEINTTVTLLRRLINNG